MMHIALAAFLTLADCRAFVEANGLTDTWDRQCEAVETGVAPRTSPRPVPKPRIEE